MGYKMLTAMALEGPDGLDVNLIDTGRTIVTAEGLIGMRSREVVNPRPGRAGTLNRTRYRDDRAIVLTGELWGADAAACWDHYEALAAAFAGAVDVDRALSWTGRRALRTMVRVVDLEPPIEVERDVLQYQATLRASDPRALSQVEHVADGATLSASGGGKVYPYTYPRGYNPAGGGAANIAVGGTVPALPTLRIYGYVTMPRLVLTATGEEVNLAGTVAAGRYLDIDMDARTVALDDGTALPQLVDYVNTEWFGMAPGSHTVQLFANNFDATARVQVRWRDAYT